MTFEQAFKKIKTKFENVDASKLQDMVLQFTFSDEDCGGTFYAEVKDGIISVEPYDYRDNNAVIDVTRVSLSAVLDGKKKFEKEIENGAMTVKGELDKFTEFTSAIKLPEKKAPAKKTSAKSAPAAKNVKKSNSVKKTENKVEPAGTKPTANTNSKAPAQKITKSTTAVKAEKEKTSEVKPVVKKSAVKKPSTNKKTK